MWFLLFVVLNTSGQEVDGGRLDGFISFNACQNGLKMLIDKHKPFTVIGECRKGKYSTSTSWTTVIPRGKV